MSGIEFYYAGKMLVVRIEEAMHRAIAEWASENDR